MPTFTSATPPHHIAPLAKNHDRTAFSCGSLLLDRYLQHQARQDADKHVAAAFVLTAPDSRRVLGYYTLSASLVSANELPDAWIKKLPRYPHLPVTLLGRLAVDQSVKGQGWGQFLLLDALHRSLTVGVNIAAMAVLVEAKDDAAEAFYRRFNFLPLQETPSRQLFLPMKTIAGLFKP